MFQPTVNSSGQQTVNSTVTLNDNRIIELGMQDIIHERNTKHSRF